MIVNSQPYKPDQRLQQQRCVGINQTQHDNTDPSMNRIGAAHQQQNSLYGAHVTTSTSNQANIMPQPNQRSSHLFDLANLQHHQHQGSLFDSAYDDVTSSLATANQNGSDQNSHNNLMSDALRAQHQHQPAPVVGHKQQQHQQDVSLYSPSSSTSLLYHVYDQINLPNDQQQANQNNFKRSNTTILNPANLFSSTMVDSGSQLTMPHHHQQQQQQSFGQPKTTTIPQQELYSSGAQFHIHQPSFNAATLHHQHQSQHNNYAPDNHQLMLDTILRQQHAATSRAQHYHNRPLSSSGASSMSGQSMALTYGRQPRVPSQLPPAPTNKSLATVLQSNQTLNHLGLTNGHLAPSSLDSRGPKKLPYESETAVGAIGLPSSRKWKRAQQRTRHFVYENGALIKCCLLLVLLAVFSLSIIKFASFNQAPNQNQNQQPLLVPPFYDRSSNIPLGNPNLPSLSSMPSKPNFEPNIEPNNEPDMHKSKLLIGEFVVKSQNYSSSEGHRASLADNIVKLMDQVFLSTEVRHVYSRMEIKNIRPHSSGAGIVVDCNIILRESIAYAAQQFGFALYTSLSQSGERLAHEPTFIIDRNSIRFNTVPDKDLAMVPPGLIPPTLVKDVPTPSSWPIGKAAESVQEPRPAETPEESSVVWSAWSVWSSCVGKDGLCDPGRLHSRLRQCIAQHTGEKVAALQCRQRFNMQDQELEVADCSATCAAVAGEMSDAPSDNNGPHTAPSLLVTEPSQSPFLLPSGLSTRVKPNKPMDPADDVYSQSSQLSASTSPSASSESHLPLPSEQPAPQMPQLDAEQQQMSCSNCTRDEICLVEQKVPFCAKTKDRTDTSGCGGWCQPETQLCQRVGNAFKCINDECVAGEWRCHDSLCIPLSKRCDGHSNCYDSSDERDCPNR